MIAGPRGSMVVPTDYPWHLLVGDVTALPAIHRRLEELPSDVRAIVLVQVTDDGDRREFESAARLDVHWLTPDDDLVEQVRALALPDAEGYVWCAGESAPMARLRECLLVEKAHPLESMRVASYWKSEGAIAADADAPEGSSAHETAAAVPPSHG